MVVSFVLTVCKIAHEAFTRLFTNIFSFFYLFVFFCFALMLVSSRRFIFHVFQWCWKNSPSGKKKTKKCLEEKSFLMFIWWSSSLGKRTGKKKTEVSTCFSHCALLCQKTSCCGTAFMNYNEANFTRIVRHFGKFAILLSRVRGRWFKLLSAC